MFLLGCTNLRKIQLQSMPYMSKSTIIIIACYFIAGYICFHSEHINMKVCEAYSTHKPNTNADFINTTVCAAYEQTQFSTRRLEKPHM